MDASKWIVIILTAWLFSSPALAETEPTSINALLLYSYHIEGKGSQKFDEGVRSSFKKDTSVSVEYFTEYMDKMRFKKENLEQQLFDHYLSKYKNKKIDIIIAYASIALDFLLKHGEELFPGTPVVFGLVSETVIKNRTFPDNYTGIISGPEFSSTLDAALTLLPDTREAVIIGGTSSVDKQYFSAAESQLKSFGRGIEINYVNQSGIEDLLRLAANQPSKTILIYSLLQRDGNGKFFAPRDVANRIAKAANVPVFGVSETHMGTGIVGGFLNSTAQIGGKSATTALEVIKGNEQTEFTTTSGGTHSYIFDWRQLQRWDIDESRLPAGSVVRYKILTFWDMYFKWIIGAVSLLLFEALLIVYLFISRARRIRTERFLRKSETALRQSEGKYRYLYEHMTQGVVLQDGDGKIIEANRAAGEILGLTMDQMLGKTAYDPRWKLIREDGTPFDPAEMPSNIALRTGEPVQGISCGIYVPESDEYRWVLIGSTPQFREGETEPFVTMTVFTDISERKAMENQLLQSQKMEAVGQLSGGLAHDLNNVLGIISMNVGMLGRNQADSERIDNVTKGIARASELTRKLLDYSRTEAGETKRVSVNEFVQGMESLIAKSLTPAIAVETNLARDLWLVDIDPGDLEDAILNLALNAGDAMPDGGILVVDTANKVIDETYVKQNPESSAGEFVMISMSDTGTGMTPESLKRAFEPFFTTKDVGKGTGLGLNMVYGFVGRSGGHVKIYSELGEGTTVRLYLPRASGETESGEIRSSDRQGLPGGDETILVVDDEEELADVAVSFLESLGYRAVSASSAKKVMEILQEDPSIDLLFSDVIMPGGMDGYNLAMEALGSRPDVKVLLTSGFTRKREEFANGSNRIASDLAANLLHKPYNIDELAVAVRGALDRSGSGPH